MYCSNCGQQTNPQDRFCLNCGMQIAGKSRNPRKWVLPIALFGIVLIITSVLLIALPRGGTYQYGNTDGNLQNIGLAAEQGDWIYYVNFTEDDEGSFTGNVNKIRKDGTGRETIAKLEDDRPLFLNVIDNWIYFSSERGINKICTDGSNPTKLSSKPGIFLSVINDWVYFLGCKYGNLDLEGIDGLYKMKIDGSELTNLFDDIIYTMSVAGEWIYYLADNESGESEEVGLYKITTDGTEKTLISNDVSVLYSYVMVIASEDWLYYLDNEEYLCKIKTDGSGKEKLVKVDYPEWFNVGGEWIYYTDWDGSSDNLYKMRTDGSGRTKILKEECQVINVVGDWIYYLSESDEFYRIRTDGSGKEKVQ